MRSSRTSHNTKRVLFNTYLHDLPKTLLPLEDCLFRHNVGHDLVGKATGEEMMSEILCAATAIHIINRLQVSNSSKQKKQKNMHP
jgi:hypothetical protein